MLSPKCASTASYQSLSAYLGFNRRKLDGLKYAQVFSRNQIPALQKNHKKNNEVHANHNVVASESLHAMKKLKCMDARDDLASGHIPKDMKTVLPCCTFIEDKSSKMLELKRSTLNSKTEKSSVHELLPMIKQHSHVQITMLGSDKVASDDKKVWNNLKLKGDAKNVTTKQSQKKRKAVCLNEDDDVPKTPVHGGAAKNIKSPFASDIKNGNNAHTGSRTLKTSETMKHLIAAA